MKKTCFRVENCKVRSAVLHNMRDEDYVRALADAGRLYILPDKYDPSSDHWQHKDLLGPVSLEEYRDNQDAIYIAKVGRRPPRDNWYTTKSGKKKLRQGFSPLREAVVLIKKDTTMEDLKKLCERLKAWLGIEAISIDIHKDEGHYNAQNEWVPNYHAHIIFDYQVLENDKVVNIRKTKELQKKLEAEKAKAEKRGEIYMGMDPAEARVYYQAGRVIDIPDQEFSQIQDVCAQILGMERGLYKSATGRFHEIRDRWAQIQQLKEITEELAKKEAERAKVNKEIKDLKADLKKTRVEFKQIKAAVAATDWTDWDRHGAEKHRAITAILSDIFPADMEMLMEKIFRGVAAVVDFFSSRGPQDLRQRLFYHERETIAQGIGAMAQITRLSHPQAGDKIVLKAYDELKDGTPYKNDKRAKLVQSEVRSVAHEMDEGLKNSRGIKI